MATESQVKANRKNALKSTGPRTAEGKEAAAQNATKHGLRAKRNVIKTENQDEFNIFRDEMIEDLSPDGAMEEMLTERIVSLSWRLKRAEHFQNAVIDAFIEHGLHGASGGFGWTSENRERATKEAAAGDVDVMLGIVINHDFANSKTLDMLLSYERRIESSLYRAIAELKKVRQAKKTENRTQDTAAGDLSDKGWHPQVQLGDGLDSACHPHPDKNHHDEDATHICANEPNLEDESSESHPHPEKDVQDEDATHLNECRAQDTASRDSSGKGWHPQAQLGDGLDLEETAWVETHPTNDTDASQENKIGTNEANLKDESSEGHPNPEKAVQDEDATRAGFQPEIENTKSEIQKNKESYEINPENCDCTNEANLLG